MAILDSIHEGCVLIVWRIPSHIALKILEAPLSSDEFYRKHGITRVEYGGECIYQEGMVQIYMLIFLCIRESVDSLCRDGADAQYIKQYLRKSRITSPQIR